MNAGTPIPQYEKAKSIPAGSTYIVEMGDGSGTKGVTQETLTKEIGNGLKIQETPITITELSETIDQAIAGMSSGSKLKDLMSRFKAFASGAKTLINACVTTGMITQQNVNNQNKVPSAALLYALNKSLTDSVSTINSNLTAEISKKVNTSNLPYGFRNIFTSLWTETAGGPDDADFGLIVRTPPAGYNGDTAYYFTFYEGGNGNKSYGIQICFSRQGAFVPMYRAKQGGRWSGWVAI